MNLLIEELMKKHGRSARQLSAGSERSIGAILVDAGRMSVEDAERALRLQKERGIRFGQAAVQLGLIDESDIQFALSHQFDYPCLLSDEKDISDEIIAAYKPFSPQVEALRAVRSQLMLRWFDEDSEHKALAVVSPSAGEGRSYLAANLAVVCSQLGEHTLLIDADMRTPRQHELFKLENQVGLSSILAGRAEIGAVQRVKSLMDLSVLPAGPVPPNPQELLSRPMFARLLEECAREFDVVIIDTPAGNAFGEAQIIALRAGGALMVVRRNQTRVRPLQAFTQKLNDANVMVVGSVLNEN